MENKIDFEGLARDLLSRAREILPAWLPGGKIKGAEYCCGSLRGEVGDSLQVNLNKGAWSDFAGNERGGDLISLYAAIQQISQVEAAKRLMENLGYQAPSFHHKPKPAAVPAPARVLPPDGCPLPSMVHTQHGKPVAHWEYQDKNGRLLFIVARYETPDGKELRPWTWDGQKWVSKGWDAPRPLYGLPELENKKNLPVLVVEGEKAADAARKIAGQYYAVVTWPNGSKAVSKADWSPVFGRNVLIWPDNDEAGETAAKEIAGILQQRCPQVKIIYPDAGDGVVPAKGWDAADALEQGYTWETFKDWAKPRAKIFVASAVAVAKAGNATAAVQQNININIESPESPEIDGTAIATWDELGLALTKSGAPVVNPGNALRVLNRLSKFKEFVWYDEFHKRYFTNRDGVVREWRDTDTIDLMFFMQEKLGILKMSDEMVMKAVIQYAQARKRNEPQDWISSLKWDGVKRLESFFTDILEADDTAYTRAASVNFWVGLIARIFNPGCQLDTMVVLEGMQGIRKTSALRVIGGKWFTDVKYSVDNPNFLQCLEGKIIVEIPEMDAFSKADINRIKSILSSPIDRYRAPYAKAAEDFNRTSIFVGTTNEDHYLRDHTGGRRFWPIKCGNIAFELLKENREQYFAEALALFRAGASWWEMPAEETKAMQEDRRQADEWEEVIASYLFGKSQTTMSELAYEALGVETARLDMMTQRRIGTVLKALNWHKTQSRSIEGNKKIWKPIPINSVAPMPIEWDA